MNIPKKGMNVLKMGTIVAILSTLIACATPPQVQNDPAIPDNGMIILNNNPYPSYCQYPYQIGSYCDPYWGQIYWNYEAKKRYIYPDKRVDRDN